MHLKSSTLEFDGLVLFYNTQELEPVHLEQQLALRQKQLREVAGTVKVSACHIFVLWHVTHSLKYCLFTRVCNCLHKVFEMLVT